MKFSCPQTTLVNHLNQIIGVVPNRPTHTILNHILIETDINHVYLTAFDLNLGIKTQFETEIDQVGAIAIPAKLFTNLVNSLPSKEITIEVEEDKPLVYMGCEEAKYQIQGQFAKEFPQLPQLTANNSLTLPAKQFIEGIIPTLNSYATNETKLVLTGIYLTNQEDTLEIASTDGHRLAVTQQTLENSPSMAITIPGIALEHLVKLTKPTDSPIQDTPITVGFDEAQIQLSWANTHLVCRALTGQYPSYNQLIPANFQISVTVLAQQLQTALNRLLLLNSRQRIIRLECHYDTQQINLTHLEADLGNGIEAIPAQISQDLTISFNGKYILDAVKSLPGKELQLQANDGNSPAILQSLETPLQVAKVMLMPCFMRQESTKLTQSATEEKNPTKPTKTSRRQTPQKQKKLTVVGEIKQEA